MSKRFLNDLRDTIEYIITSAFETLYKVTDEQYIALNEITLDYMCCSGDELPICNVSARLKTSFSEQIEVEFTINLDKSDEYNIGYCVKQLEDQEDQ